MKGKIDFSQYSGTASFAKARELTEMLSRELFVGPDTGMPYRTINYWDKVGLIDDRREDHLNWRRFTFVEFVWIRLVDELRTIGLPVPSVKVLKELLMTPTPVIDLWTLMVGLGDFEKLIGGTGEKVDQAEWEKFMVQLFTEEEGKEERITLLQLLIATVIAKRCPVIVIAFQNGEGFWIEKREGFVVPPEYEERFTNESHVRIPLHSIIKEFLTGDLVLDRIKDLPLLEENEMYLLELIHSGEYASITVKFKDQQMNSLELVKSQDAKKKIVDVLAEGDYQDITIVTHKGIVSKIENRIKVNLD